jgi:L-alanine-DL-glutamate epimerase-like enolase superfamily enzyme
VNWSVSHAIQMAKALGKYDIYWLEEALPQDNISGYVRLTRNSPVLIAGGEGEYNRYMFERWLRDHAVDIIQPDICRAGGFTEGMRVADLVQFHNLTLVPHGFSSAVSVAANLQFISAIPRGELLEFRRTKSPLMAQLIKNPFEATNGRLKIPDKPGLGIELETEIVEQLRVRTREPN